MKKHADDLVKLNIPFIFDPGQQLPMFNGEELIDFINKATYVTTNDYEIELLMSRTGLTLPDIASRVEALIVTRGEQGSEIYTQGERIEIPACRRNRCWIRPVAATPTAPACCSASPMAGTETTGRLASLLGAIKIAHKGAQNHSFTAAEIADQFEAAFGYRY
jgi:adenosine kinase